MNGLATSATSVGVDIVYQDDDLVVVDKPTMLLSVPGRGEDKRDSVVTRLEDVYEWIREVHRLDWETSGLMLLARNAQAHSELSRQFRDREVQKRYYAVVDGRPEQSEGDVRLPLRGDWPNRPRQMVDTEKGKPSHTQWRVLEEGAGCSRMELVPFTGRSHQLRVHMQAIGHPILGDRLYAHQDVQQRAARLLLHAGYLGFCHPRSGAWLEFDSAAPF